MTKITKSALLALSLTLFSTSTSLFLPSAIADNETNSSGDAATTSGAKTKSKATKVTSKKRAKLKKQATDIVKNGVEDANSKITGK